MLEEVLRYINNRFERRVTRGTFTIENGFLEYDGLVNGQYYWVEGSVFNDGLHLHPSADLADETFDGAIAELVVPNAVVKLACEIEEWCEKNGEVVSSPLASESFGGYSYTRASGGATGNENPAAAWQLQFGARLRPYRKLRREWV